MSTPTLTLTELAELALTMGYRTEITGTGGNVVGLSVTFQELEDFIAAAADRTPFVAYVSSSGDLTTWTGLVLAKGVPAARSVSRSGSKIHAWRFVAADGSHWYGRNGGPGMIITVRRAKH